MINKVHNKIPITDSHVHLWDINQLDYPWLAMEPEINSSFLIENYQTDTKDHGIDKMVFIQAECSPDQFIKELEFAERQASLDPRIQAIVAYAPLEKGQKVFDLLEQYQAHPMVKGVRRMFDDNPYLCQDNLYCESVRALARYDLSIDLSIVPASIPYTLKLIKSCPDTLFILDHLAKPAIKDKKFAEYQKNLADLAVFPNVVAKISGLLPLADRKNWTVQEISPYLEYALEKFGCDRLMFGSDWPVVLLGGSFVQWKDLVMNLSGNASSQEIIKLFYQTANKIYRI